MSLCVIFNPTAKGDRARRFRSHLDELRSSASLWATSGPGDATRLALRAIADGFQTIVAAGGDGTVNEVVGGFAQAGAAPGARLAILPLGTMNVFARELGIPTRTEDAWRIAHDGRERRVDLPQVRHSFDGRPRARAFAQMAGAGIDARAIELVEWRWKKRVGPLAYLVAGLAAYRAPQPWIRARAGDRTLEGRFVLIGNGRLYGGSLLMFPGAKPDDGLLDAAVFPRFGVATVLRCAASLLLRKRLPGGAVVRLRAPELELTSAERVPFELDGEFGGELPATFGFCAHALRVLVP